jgi:hypothetical protein
MRDSRNSAVSTLRSLEDKVEWYEDITEEMFGFKLQPYMVRSTTVTVTSYNPLEEQCDSTPLIASDNGLVAPGIIALPKHYREELSLNLGDMVWIPPYGQFVIRDHMNSNKPSGRVDIISFIPKWSKRFGRDVRTMYWFVNTEVK